MLLTLSPFHFFSLKYKIGFLLLLCPSTNCWNHISPQTFFCFVLRLSDGVFSSCTDTWKNHTVHALIGSLPRQIVFFHFIWIAKLREKNASIGRILSSIICENGLLLNCRRHVKVECRHCASHTSFHALSFEECR